MLFDLVELHSLAHLEPVTDQLRSLQSIHDLNGYTVGAISINDFGTEILRRRVLRIGVN